MSSQAMGEAGELKRLILQLCGRVKTLEDIVDQLKGELAESRRGQG